MKKIFVVVILYLITSLPVFAGQTYTNSTLDKYNVYKSAPKVENNNSESTTDETAAVNQEKITIDVQKMEWTGTNEDGSEKNYAWEVRLVSTFAMSKQVGIEFSLRDKDDAIMSVANENGTIDSSGTKTFKGTGIVKSQLVPQVVSTSVKLTVR